MLVFIIQFFKKRTLLVNLIRSRLPLNQELEIKKGISKNRDTLNYKWFIENYN
jgi:hypothetical protein